MAVRRIETRTRTLGRGVCAFVCVDCLSIRIRRRVRVVGNGFQLARGTHNPIDLHLAGAGREGSVRGSPGRKYIVTRAIGKLPGVFFARQHLAAVIFGEPRLDVSAPLRVVSADLVLGGRNREFSFQRVVPADPQAVVRAAAVDFVAVVVPATEGTGGSLAKGPAQGAFVGIVLVAGVAHGIKIGPLGIHGVEGIKELRIGAFFRG
mmetsp:Transcript_24840/g.55464  ORF Transcript_24840/g.55464 Transcript_24840/m.55464 type:complete len:206 (+) Transcript_24840:988-1605(+)